MGTSAIQKICGLVDNSMVLRFLQEKINFDMFNEFSKFREVRKKKNVVIRILTFFFFIFKKVTDVWKIEKPEILIGKEGNFSETCQYKQKKNDENLPVIKIIKATCVESWSEKCQILERNYNINY